MNVSLSCPKYLKLSQCLPWQNILDYFDEIDHTVCIIDV